MCVCGPAAPHAHLLYISKRADVTALKFAIMVVQTAITNMVQYMSHVLHLQSHLPIENRRFWL